MGHPQLRTFLKRSSSRLNPQDLAAIPCVVGPSSAGPLNSPTTITTAVDLDPFVDGEGVHLCAEILASCGGPVIFVRSETTTVPTVGTVYKTPAEIAATVLRGGLLLAGADQNGEVFLTAKETGLSIELIDPPGNNVPLSSTYINGLISVTLATDGVSAVTTTAALLAAHLNATHAVRTAAIAQGTGATLIFAAAANNVGDDSHLSYVPKRSGVTVAHVAAGNNTALSVAVASLAITVNLATDANGTPTSTGTLVKAAIEASAAAMALLSSVTTSGTGGDPAGVWAAQTLIYGSTAALVLSGTAKDSYNYLEFICTRAGTVGGTSPPAGTWSADGGRSVSGEVLIPGSGAVSLADSLLDTGLTATFTGVLAVGDRWRAWTTGPQSSATAIATAAQKALDDKAKKWGYLITASPHTRSEAGGIDTKVQSALRTKYPSAILAGRDQGTGTGIAAEETEAEWRDAVLLDYAGFVSSRGLIQVAVGHGWHLSPKTRRTYWRSVAFWAAQRRSASPVHENLGKVATGVLKNVGSTFGRLLVPATTGDGGLLYQARAKGVEVEHIASGANTPLSISVSGKKITVNLATDGSSVVTSTAANVRAAIVDGKAASDLVAVQATGTGAGLVSAQAVATLDEGVRGMPFSHISALQSGLVDRFIVPTIYDQNAGAYYLAKSPTMADPSDTGYTTGEWVAIALSIARIANEAAFPYLMDTLPSIPNAESAVIPAGALTAEQSAAIETDIGGSISRFLFRKKSDGQPSAGVYGTNSDGTPQKPCTVLRTNNYQADREILLECGFNPKAPVETITISVQPTLA